MLVPALNAAMSAEQLICDVPALNVRLVCVEKPTAALADKLTVEAFKFIVLMFELLDVIDPAVTA